LREQAITNRKSAGSAGPPAIAHRTASGVPLIDGLGSRMRSWSGCPRSVIISTCTSCAKTRTGVPAWRWPMPMWCQPTVVPQDERAVRVDLVVADTEVGLPTAGPKKNDVAGHLRMVSCDIAVERVTGIEPAQSAWKAGDRRHRCWARLRPADRVFPPSRVMLCASMCATAGRSQLSAAMRG
jgi:hypothetical protein